MKTVAVFGGSFNPPHPGHFEMAQYVCDTLGIDEIWFQFSQNWQKDESQYAPLEDRMEMGRILAAHYPSMPFMMSDVQEELGTHITYDVLVALRARYPDIHFIWMMGADNLAGFHTWEHYKDLIQNFPVLVFDRAPYTDAAKNSPVAKEFADLELAEAADIKAVNVGWHFLNNPKIDMSSSDLLLELQQDKDKDYSGALGDVVSYIREKGLYKAS